MTTAPTDGHGVARFPPGEVVGMGYFPDELDLPGDSTARTRAGDREV